MDTSVRVVPASELAMPLRVSAPKRAVDTPSAAAITTPELCAMALGILALILAEAFSNDPSILFSRYLWFDELQVKLVAGEPGILHSMSVLAHSPEIMPPTYHLVGKAAWWIAGLFGASAETAFRALALAGSWLALVF